MIDTHLEHGRRTPAQVALDVVRGALIGTAETVPGVSGGTVALMTGVYEVLLTSAGHAIAARYDMVTLAQRYLELYDRVGAGAPDRVGSAHGASVDQ